MTGAGVNRHNTLCTALRGLDTAAMTLPEILEACAAVAPGATPPEILAAMRQVAEEQLAEAEQLERFARCRKAGITAVIRRNEP